MQIIDLKTTPEEQIVFRAASVLHAGKLLIYPTETVYGLGVDATNQEAVNKLLKFKGQRGNKSILIAVSDQKMAEEYVELNDAARRLYRTFLPGPVAVVSRAKPGRMTEVPHVPQVPQVTQTERAFSSEARATRATRGTSLAVGIASIDGTVGIRIPNYPLVLNIIKAFGKPITSTSANISGEKNPWSINDIIKNTPKNKRELIKLFLDAGQLPKRPPSTIVDTSREKTEIVREGSVEIAMSGQRLATRTYHSNSPEETLEIGRKLMNELSHSLVTSRYPLIIALHGPLGAGKTVFAKGIARALGIIVPIRSPSYTLVREYAIPSPHSGLSLSGRSVSEESESQSRGPSALFYHIDAWRLSDPREFQDLGFEQMFKPGNVIAIEWIERLSPILSSLQKKANVVFVEIDVVNDRERNVKITM